MTRVPRAVIDEIDALVGKFDADTLNKPFAAPATSSWAVVAAAWQRFKSLVDALDEAVSSPLAKTSPKTLRRAQALVGDEAYRLSFWLVHVSAAIARHRRPSAPSRSR